MIHHGCCLDVLRTMPDNSVDSVVTDPPYGLSFMGKKWDYDVPSVEIWRECLRVLKPGGHLLAFAGTRTQHRMCVRIEDAGFEIRDMLAWVYGSGFPKSLNAKTAIAEKLVPGWEDGMPVPPEAQQWGGWGTALKPALEPITLARKPLDNCTVATNVLKWGTGGINVDGCRVESDLSEMEGRSGKSTPNKIYGANINGGGVAEGTWKPNTQGRWPANLIHDGSEEVTGLFPQSKSGVQTQPLAKGGIWNTEKGNAPAAAQYGDSGSAARFFYCAKASRSERDAGCDELEHTTPGEITGGRQEGSAGLDNPRAGAGRTSGGRNIHPTVKPLALMRYLVRLVTPPGGVTLDPFLGSGTTAVAALQEGFRVIGIERDEHSYKTAMHRYRDEILKDPFF